MVNILEYRPTWAVPGAGDAQSVFHWSGLAEDQDVACAAIRTFFNSLAGNIPNDVTISFPSELFEVDGVTGALVDIHPVTAPSAVTGTNSGSWSGGVGACFKWDTGIVLGGRRLRGKTFLTPCSGNSFDVDGTLAAAVVTALVGVANTLLSSMSTNGTPLVILSKTHGDWATVASVSVPDRSAILRSRRD